MTSSHDQPPSQERTEFVRLLTMALIRLTSQQKGNGAHTRWRAEIGYDPNVLEDLSRMGLIELSQDGSSVELTESGVTVSEGATLIVANAFDRALGQGEYASAAPTEPPEDIPLFDPLPYRIENDRRAFLLRIELDLEGLHPCWREVLVPATCSFLDLHIIIQLVFNWYDEHLFNFEMVAHSQNLHMEEHAVQIPEDAFVPSGYALATAHDVLLGDVFPRSRTARYSYDYGDGWEHKVKVVKTLRDADITAPQLMDGKGDAPPEDVGGPGGFEDFLVTISSPFNAGCVDALAWAESQGYEPFDLKNKQRDLAEQFEDYRSVWLGTLGKAHASTGKPADAGRSLRFV